MTKVAVAVWRRRLGVGCSVTGSLLFSTAVSAYLRYTNLKNPHVQERLQYGHLLNHLWQVDLYGGLVLALASLFGLGWSRWVGLITNIGSFLYAMMTLGAMCGPYNCS